MKSSAINVSVKEIMQEFSPKGILLETTGDAIVTGISAVDDCGPGDLVFVDKKDYLSLVKERAPAVVVTSSNLKTELSGVGNLVVIVAPNVSLAHALIKQKYAPRDFNAAGWSGIHPSAVVHESAQIHSSSVVEPKVVIGQNVKIGKNCRIMAGVVIENDVSIGDETTVHPLVVVGYGCRIGNQVVIESGSVIGSQGYSFAQDEKRKSHAIPQTGVVVIEDRVRVGAGNCIDRAAYHETRIGAGTKLDNLCHIAHNVQVGQDCLLTAMICVAGSTKIGDRVIASGQTGILDHVNVCSDTVLLHRAGVNKDIEKPGAYAGSPVQPLSDYMKNTAVLRTATELRKRIMDLEKKL